jgi:hypothetical protein
MPTTPDPLQGDAIAADLEHVDATETVTLTQTATMTEKTVEHALRRPVSLREIEASGGSYARGDMKFNLPQDQTSFVPVAGDTITDAATQVWNIQEVERLALGTRYRCWCKPA